MASSESATLPSLHRNLIGGEWVDGTPVPNVNPSNTDDVIGEFVRGNQSDARHAIAAAADAFPEWSTASPQARADVLQRASQEVLARADELGDLLAREEGKTLPEARGEVVRAAQVLGFHAGQAVRNSGELIDSVRPGVEVAVTRSERRKPSPVMLRPMG